MNHDEMIEKAARALRVAVYPSLANGSWDNLPLSDQEHYLHAAHATRTVAHKGTHCRAL